MDMSKIEAKQEELRKRIDELDAVEEVLRSIYSKRNFYMDVEYDENNEVIRDEDGNVSYKAPVESDTSYYRSYKVMTDIITMIEKKYL